MVSFGDEEWLKVFELLPIEAKFRLAQVSHGLRALSRSADFLETLKYQLRVGGLLCGIEGSIQLKSLWLNAFELIRSKHIDSYKSNFEALSMGRFRHSYLKNSKFTEFAAEFNEESKLRNENVWVASGPASLWFRTQNGVHSGLPTDWDVEFSLKHELLYAFAPAGASCTRMGANFEFNHFIQRELSNRCDSTSTSIGQETKGKKRLESSLPQQSESFSSPQIQSDNPSLLPEDEVQSGFVEIESDDDAATEDKRDEDWMQSDCEPEEEEPPSSEDYQVSEEEDGSEFEISARTSKRNRRPSRTPNKRARHADSLPTKNRRTMMTRRKSKLSQICAKSGKSTIHRMPEAQHGTQPIATPPELERIDTWLLKHTQFLTSENAIDVCIVYVWNQNYMIAALICREGFMIVSKFSRKHPQQHPQRQ
eukprot:Gregarina_sp_Poly_1__600@NODE_1141_length_4960_cov_269_731453_g787_i0_p1_GENE_NODE_1141_length_4960_cov_269_731453_g787_i0NODE_1141_length_4960_cov_269_731453_g787_i0_p1_ORF_typecomplete_len423_score57_98YL1/PF05764_13/7_9e05_NODE_1141_length_4960_cov_269_731453_g787_i021903458